MSSPAADVDLHVAVLMTEPVQLLDLSAIDLFAMLDTDYLKIGLPKHVADLGKKVQITYVGLPARSYDHQEGVGDSFEGARGFQHTTAQLKVQLDATLESPAVQPGEVDVLLIPGPDPTREVAEETCDFVRRHAEPNWTKYDKGRKTVILTICTGCLVPATAGLYDGRRASAPRALVPEMKKRFPKVTWDEERRWVKDELEGATTLWSSGGITNGLEMTAAYLKDAYPGPLTNMVCEMADVGGKGEFYDTNSAVDTAWWLGQILRAFFTGKKGRRA